MDVYEKINVHLAERLADSRTNEVVKQMRKSVNEDYVQHITFVTNLIKEIKQIIKQEENGTEEEN